MDYWIDLAFWSGGRLRTKRMCSPFRSRAAAEGYIERWLSHRKDIAQIDVTGEDSGFYAWIDGEHEERTAA